MYSWYFIGPPFQVWSPVGSRIGRVVARAYRPESDDLLAEINYIPLIKAGGWNPQKQND